MPMEYVQHSSVKRPIPGQNRTTDDSVFFLQSAISEECERHNDIKTCSWYETNYRTGGINHCRLDSMWIEVM